MPYSLKCLFAARPRHPRNGEKLTDPVQLFVGVNGLSSEAPEAIDPLAATAVPPQPCLDCGFDDPDGNFINEELYGDPPDSDCDYACAHDDMPHSCLALVPSVDGRNVW